MPSLMDPNPDGTPWPAVGVKKETAFGGAAGSVLRPFALKKCAEVASNPKIKIPILGTGGIVGPDNAIAFIRYGASVLQVCSAVQNLDAPTVVYDLETGLKAHIYLS
jgi:dihydropyrimidine dehydrogenase (NADP+)